MVLGNNTYQAGPGYDFATGLGVPKMDGLIESLGGVVGSSGINVVATANFFDALNNAQTDVPVVTSFRATGSASFGPFSVGLGLTFTVTSRLNAGSTATLNIPLFTRNLDGTVQGQAQANLHIVYNHNDGSITTTDTNIPVEVVGTLSRAHRHWIINGEFYTIDANGDRVPVGASQIFQGTFHSV
jgi:hypothetical protein